MLLPTPDKVLPAEAHPGDAWIQLCPFRHIQHCIHRWPHHLHSRSFFSTKPPLSSLKIPFPKKKKKKLKRLSMDVCWVRKIKPSRCQRFRAKNPGWKFGFSGSTTSGDSKAFRNPEIPGPKYPFHRQESPAAFPVHRDPTQLPGRLRPATGSECQGLGTDSPTTRTPGISHRRNSLSSGIPKLQVCF